MRWFEEIDPDFTYTPLVRADGTREWWWRGRRHREDGPAIEWANGTREWYVNGRRHREDGPAVERPDGTREWWRRGELHREDGPAYEGPDGTEWWIDGKPVKPPRKDHG